MLVEVIPEKKDFIKTGPFLQQTAFWGALKELQGRTTKAFSVRINYESLSHGKFSSNIASDVLVVLRDVGLGNYLAHVPYGPVFEPHEELQGHFLEELSEALRPYLPKTCFCIRYDLPWKSPWSDDALDSADQEEQWRPPRNELQELRMNMETETKNLRKAPKNLLPVNTLFLDLQRNENKLLRQMKAKTRYNIKLSQRKGVRVFEAGWEELDAWYHLYKETAQRNHFVLHDKQYFESLLQAKRIHAANDISINLLMAESEGELLAGMFLGISEKQAVYLYGASSRKRSSHMAPYALQWMAIRRARQAGCRYYDMFGIAPAAEPSHAMYGLYRFKTGFGGEIFHRQGCWDYPLDSSGYKVYRGGELNDSGFHIKQRIQ